MIDNLVASVGLTSTLSLNSVIISCIVFPSELSEAIAQSALISIFIFSVKSAFFTFALLDKSNHSIAVFSSAESSLFISMPLFCKISPTILIILKN
jgi:hypothetical protein